MNWTSLGMFNSMTRTSDDASVRPLEAVGLCIMRRD
jgi:hypothetical protein